tara:strand:- start:969 stop:1286 length:318 start_codon:yes stop_codon:yes gene_type:complete
MKITFEDKINGTSTWEPTSDDFEIHEVLQAIKGMLVSHGYHELVVDEAFEGMAQDIKDERQEEDNSAVIDPLETELYKACKAIKDNVLNWPNGFPGAHSNKGTNE